MSDRKHVVGHGRFDPYPTPIVPRVVPTRAATGPDLDQLRANVVEAAIHWRRKICTTDHLTARRALVVDEALWERADEAARERMKWSASLSATGHVVYWVDEPRCSSPCSTA